MATTDQTTRSHATSRDGTVIGDVTTGEGPPLVLVHGALADHSRWRVMLPYLEPPAGPLAELEPPGLQERMVALLAADDREGILVTGYRDIAGLSDAQIDDLRSQSGWPDRLVAAHTVPRELATPFEQVFDPVQAANVAVPALVLVGSETSEAFKASAEIVAGALPAAHITILPGQAHGAEMSAPEVVADAVLDFLSGREVPDGEDQETA